MSLTRSLVQLVRQKSIERDDLEAAALFVLDTIACAVGGTQTPQGRILLDWSKSRGPDAASQAFLLGGLAHILEMDDLHRDSVTHQGCVVVPPAWAVAGSMKLDGSSFLKAILQGYEIGARIGMSVGKEHYRLWHNTATCGPFASAMAVSSLLRLSDEQPVWALGNAGTQSCGLWQFLEEGAMSKHLHTAHAAEAGLTSAELAARGFTGPTKILEGEKGFFRAACPDAEAARVLADPDGPWQLRLTSIKPWPSCRHTHPAIEAGLALHTETQGLDISSVLVETYQAALDLCDRPDPTTEYEAKFSLQHCVATALCDGQVTLGSFGQARERPPVLRPSVRLARSDTHENAYPKRWGARVTIETESGETLNVNRPTCKGDPEAPVSADEMSAKALMLLEFGGLKSTRATTLIDGILALPDGGKVPELPWSEN